MSSLKRLTSAAACVLFCALTVIAQTARTTPSELNILIGERQIKFTPLKAYEQIRLEVFNNTGELIYDSSAVTEADLNYNLHDSNGQPLAPGLYAYTLSIKVAGAEAPRQHQGHFILEQGNERLWITTKDTDGVGTEVTGGQLTVARSPERTIAGAGYLASGRTLGERAGLQRDSQGRTLDEKKVGVGREDGQPTLNISGTGTTNQLTRWLDGPNGVVGDSIIHQTASGDLGVGTTNPGGVFDLQRASSGDILHRFWNTGTGGSKLRYVSANGATAQVQFTSLTEWLSSIATIDSAGVQFRVRGVGATNTEAELDNSTRMAIRRDGTVLVGTTAPQFGNARMEVNNTTSAYALIAYGNNSNLNGALSGIAQNVNSVYGTLGEISSPTGYGVWGLAHGATGRGVLGETDLTTGESVGVYGSTHSITDGTAGVFGGANGTTGSGNGVYGLSYSSSGTGVKGEAISTDSSAYAVVGIATAPALAGRFVGNVDVSGTFTAGTKLFKIDHPLDPENKYLNHVSVESPEMMNIYNGNVTTDANAEATVTLPAWFQALNRDFRYQLTVVGQFATAIVAEEISGNKFKIRTSIPNVKVSWQVTGVRQDAYANKHRVQVEEDKPVVERGSYLYPEAFNQPEEKGAMWRHRPVDMKKFKQARENPPPPRSSVRTPASPRQ